VNKFRGQYMDMVHPSSDVQLSDKPNHADQLAKSSPPDPTPPEPEKEEIPPDTVDDREAYESPFLPNVAVEKRPLGGGSPADNTRQLFGIDEEAHDTFDINNLVDLSRPELPADDSGKGELEPALPPGDEPGLESEPEPAEPEPEPEPLPAPEEPESTPEPEPEKPEPIPKTPETVDNQPQAPFAHAAEPAAKPGSKKPHLWALPIFFVLLAIIGAAIGALIYLSGWFE